METVVYHKTYGIKTVFIKGKQRFLVVCDGFPTTDLHYARAEFALKASEQFCRDVYRDFIDFQGRQVRFTFSRV